MKCEDGKGSGNAEMQDGYSGVSWVIEHENIYMVSNDATHYFTAFEVHVVLATYKRPQDNYPNAVVSVGGFVRSENQQWGNVVLFIKKIVAGGVEQTFDLPRQGSVVPPDYAQGNRIGHLTHKVKGSLAANIDSAIRRGDPIDVVLGWGFYAHPNQIPPRP